MPEAARRPFRATVAAVLVALALSACGGGDGQGSNTSCDLGGCTITFPRSGAGEVSVLGVTARLVGVDNSVATIDIAGNTVQVPVGAEQQADGFTVGVDQVTDTQVVVRVRLGAGGS
jgi:hypothetical protein